MSLAHALVVAAAFLLSPLAHAQARPDNPFRSSVTLGGLYMAGNVGQATANADIRLSHSDKTWGYDGLASAFRLWIRPAPDAELIRVGDTLALTALPFWYLADRWFVLGTARYEHSALRGLAGRTNGGAGIGFAPVREEDKLLRVALGAQLEHSRFAEANLAPGWVEDGPERLVGRAALQSNGWLRVKRSRVSLRYVGGLFVNPVDPRDLRGFVDGSASVEVARQLALRVGGSLLHDTVVPAGIQPTDLRVTAGLSWKRPARPEEPPPPSAP